MSTLASAVSFTTFSIGPFLPGAVNVIVWASASTAPISPLNLIAPGFLSPSGLGLSALGLSGFVEAETGPMAYLNQIEAKIEPGFRAGVGIGASYLRMKRGLLPRFAFALTLDHVPGWGGTGTVTQVSAGLKAGFDLSR